MADRDKQFIGSMSPQDLGEPAPGIAEADQDATGWDLRSLEDVEGENGEQPKKRAADEGTPEDLGEDYDEDAELTIYGSGGPGTRLPDDLMTGPDEDTPGKTG